MQDMGLKPNFTIAGVRARFERIADKTEAEYINTLAYLGEESVNFARLNAGYTDQTGNLKSSIGYVILKDGQVINENFEQVLNGGEGLAIGQSQASQAALNYPRGFVLIIVAGMDYARAVESRGKDVITGATLFAEQELPGLLNQLKQDLLNAR